MAVTILSSPVMSHCRHQQLLQGPSGLTLFYPMGYNLEPKLNSVYNSFFGPMHFTFEFAVLPVPSTPFLLEVYNGRQICSMFI